MAKTMKAWTFSQPGYPAALRLTDIPTPSPHLAATELHVRVHAAALNPVDIQIMNMPIWSYVPTFAAPAVKGVACDFSGIVEAAGKDSGFRPGQEVFGMSFTLTTGTLQEIAVVDVRYAVVVPKPSDWSWEQAAALPLVWLTARTTIAAVEPYMTGSKQIAVLGGSSSVGMYVCHLANARGWSVCASCSGPKTDFVRGMGANIVLAYTSKAVFEQLRAFRLDAIIDCVGGTDCIGFAKRYVTIVGDKTDRSSMGGSMTYAWNPRMLLRNLAGKIGLVNLYDCVNLSAKKEYLEEALRLPKEKIIVDSTFSFEDANRAFDRLNSGKTQGKVVVRVLED